MNWRGKEIRTIGDLMELMNRVLQNNDEVEAREFMASYQAENSNAAENIGYLTGYFTQDERMKLQKLFDVSHPIFGKGTVTADQAFNIGRALGKAMKGPSSS